MAITRVPPLQAGITSANSTVATSQTTTSGGYTDLSTVGPEVTLTTGTKALVIVSGRMTNAGGESYGAVMSYAVSGASTISATDAICVRLQNTSDGGQRQRASAASIVTLTAGSNVFTAKYKSEFSGTSTFLDREIIVINLG